MTEKYTLNWDSFSDHLKLIFRDLYQEACLSDVTLVSDDQTQFKAHKIVLSACSRVFKKIIESNPSQHPLVYLRGILSFEMESILQFMYLGEASFNHERMSEFIKVAQDLEVKEISNLELPSEGVENIVEEDIPGEEIEEGVIKETEIQEKIQPKESKTQLSNDKKSTQCPECGAVYKKRFHMLAHYRSKHEGIRYTCKYCDHTFAGMGTLKVHIQSVHEGIKYLCDQCDYQATLKYILQTHIKSQHKGVKYQCNECGNQFIQQTHLKSVHEGKKYPCVQCDYQATQQSNLQTHIATKHRD